MWLAVLSGDNESLERLYENFSPIKKEGAIYQIENSKFECLLTHEEVSICANDILGTMLGILKLDGSTCRNVKVDHIVKKDKKGLNHTYTTLKTTITITSNNAEISDKTKNEKLLQYAIENEPMQKAIVNFNDISDENICFNLYKIYELIQQDLGQNSYNVLLKKINISKNQIKKFRKTVNNSELTGKKARHAKTKNNLDNGISLDECNSLIEKLLKGYNEFKLNKLENQ